MSISRLNNLTIGIKGAGDLASAVAWRLHMANLNRIFMMEIPFPLAVRRGVSFCEAVHEKRKTVEGVQALKADSAEELEGIWAGGNVAVIVDPAWSTGAKLHPDVIVDAIIAKRNLGTQRTEAELVIGLGPGFVAGEDVHTVIETNRGHNLGRVITQGSAEANTGIPGTIGGYTAERVIRAPRSGLFRSEREIGETIEKGNIIGTVEGEEISAPLSGVIRGLIRSNIEVPRGLKLGDIDPRGDRNYCYTISDKGRAIAGAVLESILRVYNR